MLPPRDWTLFLAAATVASGAAPGFLQTVSDCTTQGSCSDTCQSQYGSCKNYYYCCDKAANCTGTCPCGSLLKPVENCCCNPNTPPLPTPAPTPAFPDPPPGPSPPAAVTLALDATSAVIQNGFVRVEFDIANPGISALHADFSGNGQYNASANVLSRPFALETLLTGGARPAAANRSHH